MGKSTQAAVLAIGAVLLGATVFAQPVAWAAQALSATIAGPLDQQGNVRVAEQAVTEVLATGRVDANSTLGPIDVRGYKAVRITVGDLSCSADDRINVATSEPSPSGSGFYRLDLIDLCAGVSAGNSKVYDVPGRTLRISCFCGAGSYGEIAVFGRSN